MIFSTTLCVLLLQNVLAYMDPILGQDKKASPQRTDPNLTFGDMMLTDKQKAALENGENMGGRKNENAFAGVKGNNLRWTNGIIPYEIDCSIENLDDAMHSVFAAMKEWESKTCLRFVKRTTEKYFVKFFRNTHCWAHVGMTSYSKVSVGYGCEFQHVMTHEIGHVVGFYHEQNRKDRDQYVDVHWENIGQFKSAFDIVKNTDSLGVPYDYESIMHYPWSAFSSNGKDTMSPRRNLNGKTPYIALSDADAKQTSLMYNCPAIMRKRQALLSRASDEKVVEKRAASQEYCEDENKYCPDWAKNGHCTKNPTVMELCKLSCGAPICSKSSCKDTKVDCPMWKKWGHCSSSNSVARACQKSCNPFCKDAVTKSPPKLTSPVGHCKDLKKECPLWKSWGHCKLNKAVAIGCQKSCNPKCGGGSVTSQPPKSTAPICIDNDEKCPMWKDWGHCKISSYVRLNCKKSCNPLCRGPTKPPTKAPTRQPTQRPTTTPKPNRKFLGKGVLCRDSESRCAKWAKQGQCESNPGYMLRNCKVSCKQTDCDQPGLKPPGACANPLGLSWDGTNNFKIPDSAFYSPENLSPGGGWQASASNARLYFEDDYTNTRIGAWCAKSHDSAKSVNGFVEVDLGEQKTITYIATQGRNKYFERVSKFKIQYSGNGQDFTMYQENGKDKIFDGNCDHRTPVLNKFNNQIQARYIRYVPWNWNYPCVRMEFYGC